MIVSHCLHVRNTNQNGHAGSSFDDRSLNFRNAPHPISFDSHVTLETWETILALNEDTKKLPMFSNFMMLLFKAFLLFLLRDIESDSFLHFTVQLIKSLDHLYSVNIC